MHVGNVMLEVLIEGVQDEADAEANEK